MVKRLRVLLEQQVDHDEFWSYAEPWLVSMQLWHKTRPVWVREGFRVDYGMTAIPISETGALVRSSFVDRIDLVLTFEGRVLSPPDRTPQWGWDRADEAVDAVMQELQSLRPLRNLLRSAGVRDVRTLYAGDLRSLRTRSDNWLVVFSPSTWDGKQALSFNGRFDAYLPASSWKELF